jgi:hypothetical protein
MGYGLGNGLDERVEEEVPLSLRTITNRTMEREEMKKQVFEILSDIIPKRDAQEVRKSLEKAKKAKTCLEGDDLGKNMMGLGGLWGYFPHFMDVVVGKTSMADKMKDEKCMDGIAEKTVDFCIKHEGGKVSRNRVFQSLKAYNGHHVSNFRPTAARDIYLHLAGPGAVVFDPCAGWGGRMIGAFAANCKRYVGVDASKKTAEGLVNLYQDLGVDNVEIHFTGIEDFKIDAPFADIAFTSPPYFDAEKYSDDQEQSWVKYPNYNDWKFGFLYPLCVKMRDSVKDGGFVAINIANIKGKDLCKDVNECLTACGLKYETTWRYVLSSIAGKGKKFEPVFIYRK